jgi:hypothetical protein
MMQDPGLMWLAGTTIAVSVFLVTLLSTDTAILLLIISMLLSPEFSLAQVPGRSVVVRLDDLLLGVIFLTWLGKLAINKQLGVIRATPLNAPLALLIVACLASTMWGMVEGTVKHPLGATFYVVKYIEYLLLYFMVANIIQREEQVRLFWRAMLITAVIVTVCAYVQLMQHGIAYRVSAPFEGKPEPNTLAGYLLLMMAMCSGLALHAPRAPYRLLMFGLVVFMFPPFLFTYSRGAYLAFIVVYLALCVLSKRYKPLLIFGLVIGAFAARTMLPATVYQRVASTFDPRSGVEVVGGARLAASPAARVIVYRYVWEKWLERPLLGFGVTGIGFVDSQYALIIGELGLLGLGAFIWLWWRIWGIAYRAFVTVTEPFAQGLSLGFVAGFAGLLVLSFAGNVFIIVRIMEPFWCLAAMVMLIPAFHAAQPKAV